MGYFQVRRTTKRAARRVSVLFKCLNVNDLISSIRALLEGSSKIDRKENPPHAFALIICSACLREVSVSLAPLNMRATSSVRSSPVMRRTLVRVRPAESFLLDQIVMIGKSCDLRQMGHAEHLIGAGQSFQLFAHGFGRAAADAGVDFVEDVALRCAPAISLVLAPRHTRPRLPRLPSGPASLGRVRRPRRSVPAGAAARRDWSRLYTPPDRSRRQSSSLLRRCR